MLAETPRIPALLSSSYAPPRDAYDEMKGPDGRVRAHWLKLFEHIDGMGREELEARWNKARQLLHENGVSYNVYGDPQGVERPWSLSPIPVLLPVSEWQEVEQSLAQRARLLNALLARPVRRTAHARRRAVPARAAVRQSRLPARLPRCARAA